MVLSISERIKWRLAVAAVWLGLAVTMSIQPVGSQTVRSKEEIERILAIEKLSINEGEVSGEVRNKANHSVRDVQLFIRYTWLWEDERNPGKVDPGTSTYYTLPQEIPARGSVRFSYKPSPPLPKITGGGFETSVTIAGFTEVIPASQK